VLNRNEGEKLRLVVGGVVVWVVVVRTTGSTATIGIDAPRSVAVHREELLPKEEKHVGKASLGRT
jgi:sRNA-binding carbon storage regulator CsrA